MLIKYLLGLLTVVLLSICIAPPSHAFIWMIYHKPAFKGKVIDAETKEPIEGAVVVAMYNKSTIGLGAGTLSSIINVREAMTDKEGMFRIPSYTTVIQPFSWEDSATFIIFKPGYGSFPDWRVNPPRNMVMRTGDGGSNFFEEFFSGEVGAVKEVWGMEAGVIGAVYKWIKVTFGVVELPKLKTREERRKASMAGVTGYRSRELPLLYKALNEEERYLGIPERE